MGLFDFLKPKLEKQTKEGANKISNQIFPNGKKQFDSEVREVRELLDFKYTLEQIIKTYSHASAIYFISKEKNQEQIINSILYNKESVITKEDASKIYNYLQKKFTPSNLNEFNFLNNLTHEQKIFLGTKGGIVEMKKFRVPNNFGKFEIILFNANFVFMVYKSKYPEKFKEFKIGFIASLMNVGIEEYKIQMTEFELFNFIQKRINFYSEEIYEMSTNKIDYSPLNLYYTFYENPLCEVPIASKDLGQVLLFFPVLVEMIGWITKDVCDKI